MDNKDSIGQVSIIVVRTLICLGYFALVNVTAASQSDVSETDEARMLFNYEAAFRTRRVRHECGSRLAEFSVISILPLSRSSGQSGSLKSRKFEM